MDSLSWSSLLRKCSLRKEHISDLNKYFSHKVSGADFPESKPNPAIFLKAVELSGHLKSECIVIEDSLNGIKDAKAAGIYCIAYKAADVDSQNQSEADKIIYDYKELNFDTIRQISIED